LIVPGPKAKSPTQDRGQRRVQLLLDAAADLILVHGAEGLKMDMVAKKAATSPGSLYQFFPNRAAILVALMERFSQELQGLASEIVRRQRADPPPSMVEAARAFLQPFLEFYARNRAYVILAEASDRVFAGQAPRFSEDDHVAAAMEEVLRPYVEVQTWDRLGVVCRLLTVVGHSSIQAAYDLDEEDRARWLGELDRLIQSYLKTLQDTGANEAFAAG
jgi:AcrR family transcriptional regulator